MWLYSSALSSTHLQLQHQVHPLLSEWVDVVQNQGNDDVNAVGLMGGDAILQDVNKNASNDTKPPHFNQFYFWYFGTWFSWQGP